MIDVFSKCPRQHFNGFAFQRLLYEIEHHSSYTYDFWRLPQIREPMTVFIGIFELHFTYLFMLIT